MPPYPSLLRQNTSFFPCILYDSGPSPSCWTSRMSLLFLYCEITFNLLSTRTPSSFLQSSLWPICTQPVQLHGIIPSSTCKILHLPLINFGDFCWSASQNSSEWQPWSPYQPLPLDECHLQSSCGCIQRYYGRPCQKPW